MRIEVLRIGQRLVRDDRVTTHVALVARAFGASKIYMTEVNPEIRDTIAKVNETWGGGFEVEFVKESMPVIRERRAAGFKLAHLTMYGRGILESQDILRAEPRLLVLVGAEKVPREVYGMADYNVGIGSQPHSEISALAVLLDRIQGGAQFQAEFSNARRKIVPSGSGKDVRMDRPRD